MDNSSYNLLRILKRYRTVVILATVGMLAFFVGASLAAPLPHLSIEAENPTASSGLIIESDSSASSGSRVRFGVTTASRFNTLPVGASLPSDSTCASQVRPAAEIRPANATFNATRGTQANTTYPRVTGNFVGSTDEILQWVACKWGIDEDMVRAQASKESYWFHRSFGDWGTSPSACLPGHPIGSDGRPGECPETIGILQVRFPFHQSAFADNNAIRSTAYNADYAYAVWRDCFEGRLGWLNTVERGATYVAGDAWGCFGVWFSGRWYTQPAVTYMNDVRNWHDIRIWETDSFKSAQ